MSPLLSTTKSKSLSEPSHSPYSSLHSTLRPESSLTILMFWSSSGHLLDQTVLATTKPPFTGSARILAPWDIPSMSIVLESLRFPSRSKLQSIALPSSLMKRQPPSKPSVYPVATRVSPSRTMPRIPPCPAWSNFVSQIVSPVSRSRAHRVACIFPKRLLPSPPPTMTVSIVVQLCLPDRVPSIKVKSPQGGLHLSQKASAESSTDDDRVPDLQDRLAATRMAALVHRPHLVSLGVNSLHNHLRCALASNRNEALAIRELNSIMGVRSLVPFSSNPILGETKTADSVEIVCKSEQRQEEGKAFHPGGPR